MTIHVVRSGETLNAIAAQYGVNPAQLGAANDVPAGGALAVGQTLVVRFPRQVHAVRPGETLSSIAAAYGTDTRALWQNNWSLSGGDALTAGQLLTISCFDEKIGAAAFNGYAYPFIDPRLLEAQLPYLTYMAPFTYGINAQGGLLPLDDGAMLSSARTHGTRPVMHLSTLTESGGFDTERGAMVLTDYAVQERLISEIFETIQDRGYVGLDVDFEYIPAAQREDYAAFIRALRLRLAPMGLPVMAALAPKTYAGQPGLLYEAHDYALLGAAADYVLLMTYEWGYTYGPPMAVAPLPNVRRVLDYAVTVIPREKIYLGIPYYGYDWPLPFRQGETRARSISNQTAVALALEERAEIQYDETAQSPWFRYTAGDGAVHEVWFEDARSLSAKLGLIREYGLHGAGYWNLMRPYPQGWTLLNGLYDILDG